MSSRFFTWFNRRYKIDSLLYFSREKQVPVHRGTIWYYFGGISLFLFGLQVLTGLLLLFYYRVGPDASFESVKFIITRVRFGWLLRSMHSWSANLMVLTVIVHLFSVFFHRSYRLPRELTWLTGVVMLFMVMAFGFSGYLLPWNQLSFFATKVGTDSVRAFPIVGDFLLKLMRGGSDVTGVTLSRFFGLHIAVLPPLFTMILALHLFFVQMQGMSEPMETQTSTAPRRTIPFLPDFALRDLLVWLVVFDLLIALSVFFPWELGTKADPFVSAPAGIKPEWYFLFVFQALKMLPAHIGPFEGELVGLTFLGIGGLALVLVPFLDRAAAKNLRNRWFDLAGALALGFFAIFTVLGYILD
jgi:cytochrome b6